MAHAFIVILLGGNALFAFLWRRKAQDAAMYRTAVITWRLHHIRTVRRLWRQYERRVNQVESEAGWDDSGMITRVLTEVRPLP